MPLEEPWIQTDGSFSYWANRRKRDANRCCDVRVVEKGAWGGVEAKKLDWLHSKTHPTRFRFSQWLRTARVGLQVQVGGTYFKSWRHREKKL